MYLGCTIMLSPKGSVWRSSFIIIFWTLSMVGAVPVAIRFLCASASNRVTPSYTAGFFTMTSYTCLLIFRFATRAYWPGISDKKPISSLMNASRVMVNWVP